MPVWEVSAVQKIWNRARTIRSESLNGSSRAKSTGICNTHDGNQDDGIENRWEGLDARKLNCNDKR